MLKALECLLLVLALSAGLSASAQFLPLQEPKYSMACYDPLYHWEKGPGTLGTSCKASVIGNAERAVALYRDFIVDHHAVFGPDPEPYIRTYTTKVISLIQQLAWDHYRDRARLEGREIDPVELESWVRLVFATAYQESHLTHYRASNNGRTDVERLHILVGDYRGERNSDGARIYNSKGMFQIQPSHHSQKGLFDLVNNIQYGIEYLYGRRAAIMGLKGAPSTAVYPALKRCKNKIFTKNGIDYRNLDRATYAAYNGGDAHVCRWDNSESVWAKNDIGFLEKYDSRPWENWIDQDLRRQLLSFQYTGNGLEYRFQFGFDLTCAAAGLDLCSVPRGDLGPLEDFLTTRVHNKLFKAILPSEEERYCVWSVDHKGFFCTEDQRDIPCLKGLAPNGNFYELHTLRIGNMAYISSLGEGRQSMCRRADKSIATTGDFIATRTEIKIRSEPHTQSRTLRVAQKGDIYQVLDFVIEPATGFDRWYRIAFYDSESGRPREGYIYGGDELDHQNFVELLMEPPPHHEVPHYIPVTGDVIQARAAIPIFEEYLGVDRSPIRGYWMPERPLTVKNVSFFGSDEEIVIEFHEVDFQIQLGQIRTFKESIAAHILDRIEVVDRRSEL